MRNKNMRCYNHEKKNMRKKLTRKKKNKTRNYIHYEQTGNSRQGRQLLFDVLDIYSFFLREDNIKFLFILPNIINSH